MTHSNALLADPIPSPDSTPVATVLVKTAGETPAKRRSPTYLPGLDGLRAVACLLVLWAHFPQVGQTAVAHWIYILRNYCAAGFMGVDIFFVLSGFLITRILLMEKDTSPSFRRFYSKRVLRIFPIYYLSLIVLTFIDPGPSVGWSALYCQNYYFAANTNLHSPLRHTWSLAVEEHFYMIWPFLLYGLPRKSSRMICTYAIPAMAVIWAALTLYFQGPEVGLAFLYRGTQFRVFSLSLGAAMAFREVSITQTHRRGWWIACLTTMGLGAAVAFAPFAIHSLAEIQMAFSQLGGSMLSTSIVLGVILCSTKPNVINRFLSLSFMRFIGTISYGLYLYHYIIFYFFGALDLKLIGYREAAILLLLPFAVAITSYFVIEKPMLRLKRYIA